MKTPKKSLHNIIIIAILSISIYYLIPNKETSLNDKKFSYDFSDENIIKSKEMYHNAYFRYKVSINSGIILEIITKNTDDFNVGDKIKLIKE